MFFQASILPSFSISPSCPVFGVHYSQPRGFDEVAANQNGSGVVCYEDGFITSCARAHRNLENELTRPGRLGNYEPRRRPERQPPTIKPPNTPRQPSNEDLEQPIRPVTLGDVQSLFARLSLISWQPQSQNKEQGKYNQENLEKGIDKCAKDLFGVTLYYFKPTTSGQSGNANFYYAGRQTGFGVENRISYSKADITIIHGKGTKVVGVTKGLLKRSLVDGSESDKYGIYSFSRSYTLSDGKRHTVEFATNINYTASDIT